ncbi:MCP four helix bundle domain-containing protein [Cohnella rhizosphaerae]|uniref:MCP four helix bundle domain-containing protein n=1 Tax=Cohnella rhizosphaerae TaxID=1457232 RepID=A0A9X4KYF3_9BACL|nr:MCP four helix bundle domain-containing protein [Cohnella rhizosphaerae]MDG0813664.1 MCP four helix bundle domain-containing protein [Cohnella rhizosphaerae]
MRWFYDMKIGKKLLASFILLALLAGVVGLIGVANMNRLDRNYTDLYENYGVALGDLGEAGMNYHNIRATMRSMLITEDDAERTQLKQTIGELDASMDESFMRFQKKSVVRFLEGTV